MKSDMGTHPHKFIILPAGSNLHRLIARAVSRGKLPYNYMNAWRDVGGIGIQLAVADWVKPGQAYINGIGR